MQATQALDTGTRVLYRGGSKPAKGTIVQRTEGTHDVNELAELDNDHAQAVEVSRFWLTVLGEGDKVPGMPLLDLVNMTAEHQDRDAVDLSGVPILVEWPDGLGGGESRLVLTGRLDRMQGEGSSVLILECGKQYDH